jgi:hypothetical protein
MHHALWSALPSIGRGNICNETAGSPSIVEPHPIPHQTKGNEANNNNGIVRREEDLLFLFSSRKSNNFLSSTKAWRERRTDGTEP